MRKTLTIAIFALVIIGTRVATTSALVVNSVTGDSLSPGSEAVIRIEVENVLDEDAQSVVLTLIFENVPFNSVGSSSDSASELDEGDEETFSFRVKANNDISAGEYQIPYLLSYKLGNQTITKNGSIGITVKGQPELSFSLSAETPVVNEKSSITLRIVNKGFADAKFVNVKIFPSGFNLLSEEEAYIGTIDSDDFETTSFDVIFKSENPTISFLVEYKDFDNKQIISNINLPLQVYSRDKAIELGIISRSNTILYVSIVLALLIIWFIWRYLSKRRRMKKSIGR